MYQVNYLTLLKCPLKIQNHFHLPLLNSNVYNSQTLNTAKFQLFVICMAVYLYYRPTPRSINSSPRSDSVMVVFSVIHNLDTLQFLRVISMTWLTAVSFSYIYYAHFYFSFLLILLYIYVLLIFPIYSRFSFRIFVSTSSNLPLSLNILLHSILFHSFCLLTTTLFPPIQQYTSISKSLFNYPQNYLI